MRRDYKMASLINAHPWSVILIAVMVVFSGALVQSAKVPTFSTIPIDTTAAVGSPVTIYCSITNLGHYQVFWNIVQNSSDSTTEEFTLGPFGNTHTSYPRFQIVGELPGEYNLRISDVAKSDAGSYICLVHDTLNVMTSAIEFGARLTVQDIAVAPELAYPMCNRDPLGNSQLVPGKYIKGDMLELICTSKGGVPLAELSWEVLHFNGGKQRLPSKTQVIGDVVTATTSIELTSLDHQSYYECTEEHPSKINPRTCTTPFTGSESRLDVRFEPEVVLTPNVVSVRVLETIKVTLSCTAYSNPPLLSQPTINLPPNRTGDWPKNDKSLVEVEFTVDDVGKSFYCRAENEDGVGEDVLEVRRLNSLPTWLVLVIIGGIAGVILFFATLTSCILCVDRSNYDDDERPSSSRPNSTRKEDDVLDGMIPIEDFQGGQESANMHHQPIHKAVTNDYETGEAAGPRYQNVNEAFNDDELVPYSPEPEADFVPVDLS